MAATPDKTLSQLWDELKVMFDELTSLTSYWMKPAKSGGWGHQMESVDAGN